MNIASTPCCGVKRLEVPELSRDKLSQKGDNVSNYDVRALEEHEHALWDKLVRQSPQGTLFHTPLWLEATGVPFRLYGCFRGDELRAGAAVGIVAPRSAGHPVAALTPYLGLLLPPSATKRVTTLLNNKELSSQNSALSE